MISILYVDDESGLLHLCKRYLEGTGDFTVDIAESAQEALEKMQISSYDAVVSDYRMPGMDGIEFLKVLRSSGEMIPFIIFTGRGREEVVIEALNSGADSYLQKGGEPNAQFAELVHMIKRAVEHHAEKTALQESEKKYRNFFETSRDAVFITSLEGDIVDVNESFIEMIGYESREELQSVNVAELYERPDERLTHIRTIADRGHTKEYPVNLRRKDGAIITTLITSVPRKDRDGNILGFQGTIRDITERKIEEERLKQAFERFKIAMDSLDALVYVVDMQSYEILFVNKYGIDTWGDIEGKICWQTIQSGQSGPCPFCTNDRLVDKAGNPAGVYRWEFQNTVTGKWYDCRDSAIRWVDGRIVRLEIAIDITGRKLAEVDRAKLLHELQVHQVEISQQNEELKRSRDEVEAGLNRFSNFYDFAPVGFFTLAQDGTIRGVNLTGAALLAVDRSHLVNRRFNFFVFEDDRPAFHEFLQRIFLGHHKEQCGIRLNKENSAPFPVRINTALSSSGQECIVVVVDMNPPTGQIISCCQTSDDPGPREITQSEKINRKQ